jgi:hypothetical protein
MFKAGELLQFQGFEGITDSHLNGTFAILIDGPFQIVGAPNYYRVYSVEQMVEFQMIFEHELRRIND